MFSPLANPVQLLLISRRCGQQLNQRYNRAVDQVANHRLSHHYYQLGNLLQFHQCSRPPLQQSNLPLSRRCSHPCNRLCSHLVCRLCSLQEIPQGNQRDNHLTNQLFSRVATRHHNPLVSPAGSQLDLQPHSHRGHRVVGPQARRQNNQRVSRLQFLQSNRL